MLNFQDDKLKCSYTPLLTEFNKSSISNNLNYSSSLKNTEQEQNCNSFLSINNSNLNNENINKQNYTNEENLYSERISNSKINLSDSEILFKKINDIKSTNKKFTNEDFVTPKKNKEKIQYIPDVFNLSSNNSKNINISNLNIKISIGNIQQNLLNSLNKVINEKPKEIDLKKEIEKNLNNYFQKKILSEKTIQKNKKSFSQQNNKSKSNSQQKYKNKSNKNIFKPDIIGYKELSYSKRKKLSISSKKNPKKKYTSIFNSMNSKKKYKEIYSERRLNTDKNSLNKIPKFIKNKSLKKTLSTKSKLSIKQNLEKLKYSTSTLEITNNTNNSNVNVKTEFNIKTVSNKSKNLKKNTIPKSTKKNKNTITHYKNNDFYERHKNDSNKLKKNKSNINFKIRFSSEKNKTLNLTNSSKNSFRDLSSRTRTNSKRKSNKFLTEEEIKNELRIKNYKLYHDYLTIHKENNYMKLKKIHIKNNEKNGVKVLKNNIKNITVAPITKITLKMFENNLKMKKDRVFKNNILEQYNYDFTFRPKNENSKY